MRLSYMMGATYKREYTMTTAVITGANRGIGLEFTKQYAANGWKIYAIVRQSSTELDALAETQDVKIIQAQLTNDDSLADAASQVDCGSIDLLINNAGTMGRGSFAESGLEYQKFGTFDREEWAEVFDINVFTPLAVVELLHEKLKLAGKSVVVTLSSMLGSNVLNSHGNMYAYRASKAAVNSLTKSLGVNLKADGIISVAMHPGWVQTAMGGEQADLSTQESVAGMRRVIARLAMKDAGRFMSWDGKEMPY